MLVRKIVDVGYKLNLVMNPISLKEKKKFSFSQWQKRRKPL
jgi:hypothetical protein